MQDRALEVKVGFVLLIAAAVLIAFIIFLGDLSFQRGTTINVDFAFSGSIQEGAPVKISGIRVGSVKQLVFLGGQASPAGGDPVQVRLVLAVDDKAKPVLRQNTEFFVSTQSLLGENYVEIVPHGLEAAPLADGAIVRGIDPARFDLLFARAYDVLEGFSILLRDNKDVFVDLLRSGASLARTLDAVLKDNGEDLRAAIKNVVVATEEATKTLQAVQKIIGDGKELSGAASDVAATAALIKKELPETMQKLSHALDEANRIAGTLQDVDRAKVKAAVEDATSALKRANAVLADANVISARVRGGQGTIGLLIQDDEIYDDLKEMLRDLKQHPWKLIWRD